MIIPVMMQIIFDIIIYNMHYLRDAKGHVIDAGLDLNDSSAIGEPCKVR